MVELFCEYIQLFAVVGYFSKKPPSYIFARIIINPFMHNVEKWQNTLKILQYTTRFLKYVWPFFEFFHEGANMVLQIFFSCHFAML